MKIKRKNRNKNKNQLIPFNSLAREREADTRRDRLSARIGPGSTRFIDARGFSLSLVFSPLYFCLFSRLSCVSTEGEWQLFEDGGKKRHGLGRFTNGGELYEGEWKEGSISGKGKYSFASGAWYDGEWVNSKFHGRGTYLWPNGSSYIGNWVENKMHGQGAFMTSQGDRYQGRFHNDRFQNSQGHWIAPMQGIQTPK